MPGLTRLLAERIAGLEFSNIPAAAVETVKCGIIGKNSLWPDDNMLQVEMNVRERGEQLLIKARGAFLAVPAHIVIRDRINAIFGERCHQTRNVTRIFSNGMIDPQLADGLVLIRIGFTTQLFDDIGMDVCFHNFHGVYSNFINPW